MIARYSSPELVRIWGEENRYRKWLEVELAVCRVLADQGEIPSEALREIEEKADFDVERIHEIEKQTHHDVISFTTAVAEKVGPASRYVHLGLTSTDVVDTAQALVLREANQIIQEAVESLARTLKRQAHRYRRVPMMGRTHGIHAEPTTLGLKLAVWYCEIERHLERFRRARANIEVGKISGPVGSFSHLAPEVEEAVCRILGLSFAAASTQTLQRDRHAEFLCVLAMLAATYEKMATEIRHLQRTEVREAQEPFGGGQKGSSSMPHKRNPILCENITGLARVVRSNAMVGLENVALWHERDISHSSAERVVLPDSTTLIHFMSLRLNSVLDGLVVDEGRMRENIDLTGGLVYSGALLLALVRRGVLRETAYVWVQRNAMRFWDDGADFKTLIKEDPDIASHLTPDEIEKAFSLKDKLSHVDAVFDRVFG